MPRARSHSAASLPSSPTGNATKAPPGAMITAVPVALDRSGRYGVKVGVTTFITTVPTGVCSKIFSFWVQCSDPGAGPGQIPIAWALRVPVQPAKPATTRNSRRLPLTAGPRCGRKVRDGTGSAGRIDP